MCVLKMKTGIASNPRLQSWGLETEDILASEPTMRSKDTSCVLPLPEAGPRLVSSSFPGATLGRISKQAPFQPGFFPLAVLLVYDLEGRDSPSASPSSSHVRQGGHHYSLALIRIISRREGWEMLTKQ